MKIFKYILFSAIIVINISLVFVIIFKNLEINIMISLIIATISLTISILTFLFSIIRYSEVNPIIGTIRNNNASGVRMCIEVFFVNRGNQTAFFRIKDVHPKNVTNIFHYVYFRLFYKVKNPNRFFFPKNWIELLPGGSISVNIDFNIPISEKKMILVLENSSLIKTNNIINIEYETI